jgi:hypothetical protein
MDFLQRLDFLADQSHFKLPLPCRQHFSEIKKSNGARHWCELSKFDPLAPPCLALIVSRLASYLFVGIDLALPVTS